MPDDVNNQAEAVDVVEALRKFLALDPHLQPNGTTTRGKVDSLCLRAGNKNDIIAALTVRIELAERENARLREAAEAVTRDGRGRSGGAVYMVMKDNFLALRAALAATRKDDHAR